MEVKKFEFHIIPGDGPSLHPIIEARDRAEATKIANRQYAGAHAINFVREIRD